MEVLPGRVVADSHLPLEEWEDRNRPVVVVVANRRDSSVEEVRIQDPREDLVEAVCRDPMVVRVVVAYQLPLFGPTTKQGCQKRRHQMHEKHWVQQRMCHQ